MQPTNVILDAIQDLLATDALTLAPATDKLRVHLAVAAFTPGPGLVVGDFTEATFDGYAFLEAGAGACQQFLDSITGNRVVQLNEPAGGWHWQVTGNTDLTQIVYGYYVTDHTDAALFGCARLDTTVPMNAIGRAIDIPYLRFTFLPGSPV